MRKRIAINLGIVAIVAIGVLLAILTPLPRAKSRPNYGSSLVAVSDATAALLKYQRDTGLITISNKDAVVLLEQYGLSSEISRIVEIFASEKRLENLPRDTILVRSAHPTPSSKDSSLLRYCGLLSGKMVILPDDLSILGSDSHGLGKVVREHVDSDLP